MRWKAQAGAIKKRRLQRLHLTTAYGGASPQGEAYARRRFPKAFPFKGKGDRLWWMRWEVRREWAVCMPPHQSRSCCAHRSTAFAAADGPLLSLRDITPARRGNYLKGKPYAGRRFPKAFPLGGRWHGGAVTDEGL